MWHAMEKTLAGGSQTAKFIVPGKWCRISRTNTPPPNRHTHTQNDFRTPQTCAEDSNIFQFLSSGSPPREAASWAASNSRPAEKHKTQWQMLYYPWQGLIQDCQLLVLQDGKSGMLQSVLSVVLFSMYMLKILGKGNQPQRWEIPVACSCTHPRVHRSVGRAAIEWRTQYSEGSWKTRQQ
jgi:hypothetical protein